MKREEAKQDLYQKVVLRILKIDTFIDKIYDDFKLELEAEYQ